MKLGWYVRRLRGMSAAEVAARVRVAARQRYWAKPARRPDPARTLLPGSRQAVLSLGPPATPPATQAATLAAADRLLAGSWPVFHLRDTAIAPAPDWFADPLTGRRAPQSGYSFALAYRDEAQVGNIKFVWELSRHQATTMLASAWWLSRDDRYAQRVADHLRAWWKDNPFLTGVHWVSAIEVGLRLLSWCWIRALLADWPGVRALFDDDPVFAAQLYQHQLYARRFRSSGSSANNHLIAELAGLSAAATVFPWFLESAEWAAWSRALLVEQVAAQTYADGLNREQASEYHLFVLEMLLAASLAARMAGAPFPQAMDGWLIRMADALAASLDSAGRPPRFGDGDEGRGLLVDAPELDHAGVVLDACRALFGAAPWWPAERGSVLGALAAQLGGNPAARDAARTTHFVGSGMTILRASTGPQEVWVRCDAGPHGFLSIAAHGHADALSIELRCGGVDVLADPGTYCYHGEPAWRGYFKGTAAHSTLMVDGQHQAVNGGPFLWLNQPVSVLDEPVGAGTWQAHHDGYCRLPDPVKHHRRVTLDGATREVTVIDWIDSGVAHDVVLSWHLGPEVDVDLSGTTARLTWPGGSAQLHLPAALVWTSHRGEQDPPLGWYSAGFGHKTPAVTLTGHGVLSSGTMVLTRFAPA